MKPEHFGDPVAAYDRLAAYYPGLCSRREPYLRGVERETILRIPQGSRSLLDVGAGNGTRALRIAKQSGIERVVLVEPSKGMVGTPVDHAEVWPVRAEDLAVECVENVGTAAPGCPVEQGSTTSAEAEEDDYPARGPRTAEGARPHPVSERFQVITCLWNVLGHIPTAEKRQHALSAIGGLLSPSGKFFLDVNHRYNLRSYGVFATSARWTLDLFHGSERNGDVTAKWSAGDSSISTYGHVFTHQEIMRLARGAGLALEERIIIDYDNGAVRRLAMLGNLLYIFRRTSRIDSSSTPQTS